jgi:Uncharacterized protein conserved in bacteria C-term(DUF2220)
MNPALLPLARELFAQWERARGGRTEPATRPFSRSWEELLDVAGLTSATDRNDAERDARALATEGWIELKPVQYKPHLLERILIPLAAEERWRNAFGFVPPSDEEVRQIREFPWEPRLAFLRESRVNIPFFELKQLHEFLAADCSPAGRDTVPIKERSLEIFGDEKRLDALAGTALFRANHLHLERDLRCELVGEPLAWRRGPAEAGARPVIVIENAGTWHSYCRWNEERRLFSAVVYGCGNRFVDGVRYLPDLFSELGGQRPLLYFGDLDPQGLLIPQEASHRLQAAKYPPIEPHPWSYRQLLTRGEGRGQPWDGESPSPTVCDWLGELAEPTRQLFSLNQRLAQEIVGWEFLRGSVPPPE